jgi:hypothetical protein
MMQNPMCRPGYVLLRRIIPSTMMMIDPNDVVRPAYETRSKRVQHSSRTDVRVKMVSQPNPSSNRPINVEWARNTVSRVTRNRGRRALVGREFDGNRI